MLFLLILLAILLLALCFVGLGVRVFFHRSHQFPDTEVGHNPQMQKRGILCPTGCPGTAGVDAQGRIGQRATCA